MRATEGPSSWNLFVHIHHKNEGAFSKKKNYLRERPMMLRQISFCNFHCCKLKAFFLSRILIFFPLPLLFIFMLLFFFFYISYFFSLLVIMISTTI